MRTILTMIVGVMTGYTLQPVPKWLAQLFVTSLLLKFIILFTAGVLNLDQITNDGLYTVGISVSIVLGLFELWRRIN